MKVFLTCLQRPARCCNWIRRSSRVWEAQLQLLVLGPVLHGLEFRDQGLGFPSTPLVTRVPFVRALGLELRAFTTALKVLAW